MCEEKGLRLVSISVVPWDKIHSAIVTFPLMLPFNFVDACVPEHSSKNADSSITVLTKIKSCLLEVSFVCLFFQIAPCKHLSVGLLSPS